MVPAEISETIHTTQGNPQLPGDRVVVVIVIIKIGLTA